MVEPLSVTTEAQRKDFLKQAHYNPFLLKSDQVLIDFLTDSGTSAMSQNQWAGMMAGDESYAGARSWTKFEKVVHELTGMPYILPTHQGRAAERILYSHLGGEGKYFISNTHFDTTRANIEFSGALAYDIPILVNQSFRVAKISHGKVVLWKVCRYPVNFPLIERLHAPYLIDF